MPEHPNSRVPRCGMVMFVLFSLIGCSSTTDPSVPTPYDPQQAAQAAMKTYDTDGDGKIADEELDKCHALKSVIARIDTNHDGVITADEIAQRLEAYQSQSTFVGVMVQLSKGGLPVAGAVVTLTPEPFMGEGFPVFQGTSDEDGAVMVEGQDSNMPGVPTGLYQVTIANPASNMKKQTGCEVSDDVGSRLNFSL